MEWHEVSLCSQTAAVDGQYRCWVQHNGRRQLNLERWWGNVAAAQGSPASCRCPRWTRLGSARLDPFHASLVSSAAVHLIVASPLLVTHQKATLASPGITPQSFKWSRGKKKCPSSSLLLLLLVTPHMHRQVILESLVQKCNCISCAVKSSIMHIDHDYDFEKKEKQKQSIRVLNQTLTKLAIQQPANTT